MRWRASLARSIADINCPGGSGKPSEFTKCDSFRPNSFARLFMRRANASTDPPSASATTTHASLPDWMMMPRMRSSTFTCEPRATKDFDPCVCHAFSETLKPLLRLTRPSFNCWNRSSSVMSLLIEAGGTGVSASFDHNTSPVAASMRTACSACVSSARAGAAAAIKARKIVKMGQRRMAHLFLLIDDNLCVVTTKLDQLSQRRIGLVQCIERSHTDAVQLLTVTLDFGHKYGARGGQTRF